jgi:hypothetical protein
MSWDVAIVKISGDFRPIAEVEAEHYLPLGEPDQVRAAIRSGFPPAEWSSPTWAVYAGPGFEIEFDLEGLQSSGSVLLHIHGAGDPISSLLRFAESNGWLAVDCSTAEFIDPKNPSCEGCEGFKSLVEGLENPSEKES